MHRYIINPSFAKKIYGYCDCVVVGSGIAGLSTAIRISKYAKVKVLTKSSLSESNTWYAQGGIAAAVKKPDWWKVHYEDTIKAGQGLCDSDAVEILVKYASRMIEDLVEIGIKFDISNGEISLTTEGGHSFPRVLHAGGDATGEEIENKLANYSRSLGEVEFFTEYPVLDILTENDHAFGILAMNHKTCRVDIHPAANIIIACGGVGQLFAQSTNPPISTGDGIAMAYRAKASIKDIEFMQFHPTVFKTNDGQLYLITEALRGEGAYLRDISGKRFMLGKHPKAELAPRDIVVKEMIKVMKNQNSDFIYLDATHIPDNILRVRFPNIIAKLKENNLSLEKDLIKVFPAAHYLNGGIKTDLKGRTDIHGLYACGETAATGAHGANRLASNSLIEGLVFGWEISKDIQKKLKKGDNLKQQKTLKAVQKIIKEYSKERDKNNENSRCAAGKEEIENITFNFRKIMSKNVGILRDRKSLKEAREFMDRYLNSAILYNCADIKTVEFLNMLTTGSLIAKAASLRTESRGTHQRNDFTNRDDNNWKKHIILKNDRAYFENVVSLNNL